jgi:hypothetical protein
LDKISKNPENPDLFIGKEEWDIYTAKWARENGIK